MNNIRYKNKYRIPSSRLINWDYSSSGWYYVTICVKNRACCLGDIYKRKMHLSKFGNIVKKYLLELPNHYKNIHLDEYNILPNHIHGIIVMQNSVETLHEASLQLARKRSLLSKIIGRFKMQSAKQINILKNSPNQSFWQSRFYDHIIRSEQSLHKIRWYIRNNHLNWDTDEENPKNIK